MPIYSNTYKVYLKSKRKAKETEENLSKAYQKKHNNFNAVKNSHKIYRNKH